jgi:hypothetical protein
LFPNIDGPTALSNSRHLSQDSTPEIMLVINKLVF